MMQVKTKSKISMPLYDVRCAGCGLPVGVSTVQHPLRNKVYHAANCIGRKPGKDINLLLRDGTIRSQVENGLSVAAVAKEHKLSRQRVYSILKG
jgi:hypothetical protein